MSDEPKLSRTNDDGWQPVTGWAAVKLWAFIALMGLLWLGSCWGVMRFVFGWL